MDCTLRDGEQTSGVSFLPHEKLMMARMLLGDVNVDRIEVASARVSEGEKDAVRDTAFHACVVLCTIDLRGQDGKAGAEALREAEHEKHDGTGGTDRSERIGTDEAPDDDGVRHVVELLEYVSGKERQREEYDVLQLAALGHLFSISHIKNSLGKITNSPTSWVGSLVVFFLFSVRQIGLHKHLEKFVTINVADKSACVIERRNVSRILRENVANKLIYRVVALLLERVIDSSKDLLHLVFSVIVYRKSHGLVVHNINPSLSKLLQIGYSINYTRVLLKLQLSLQSLVIITT